MGGSRGGGVQGVRIPLWPTMYRLCNTEPKVGPPPGPPPLFLLLVDLRWTPPPPLKQSWIRPWNPSLTQTKDGFDGDEFNHFTIGSSVDISHAEMSFVKTSFMDEMLELNCRPLPIRYSNDGVWRRDWMLPCWISLLVLHPQQINSNQNEVACSASPLSPTGHRHYPDAR